MTENVRELPSAEQLDSELKRVRGRSTFLKLLYNTAASLVVVAALAVLLSMLVLPVLRVTGTSMTPTLQNGDLVVAKRKSEFKKGDIIAFYYNNRILLKRVIGTSGDIIDIKEDGTVYVNGEKLDEPYIDEKALGECDIKLPYQVPDERIFVMGDHRATSIDSRTKQIGCIAEESVVGRVVFRVSPVKKIGFFK
ncbi:MAG: signal peptidase I [Oscillospiraceae bacterium]